MADPTTASQSGSKATPNAKGCANDAHRGRLRLGPEEGRPFSE